MQGRIAMRPYAYRIPATAARAPGPAALQAWRGVG